MYQFINLERVEIYHFETFEKTFFYIISVILRSIKIRKTLDRIKKRQWRKSYRKSGRSIAVEMNGERSPINIHL